ncbi:unnamed protein product [Diplocarpon coronariae]|nr:hypothetical protein JHW43_008321 [Diplocarpon mali]
MRDGGAPKFGESEEDGSRRVEGGGGWQWCGPERQARIGQDDVWTGAGQQAEGRDVGKKARKGGAKDRHGPGTEGTTAVEAEELVSAGARGGPRNRACRCAEKGGGGAVTLTAKGGKGRGVVVTVAEGAGEGAGEGADEDEDADEEQRAGGCDARAELSASGRVVSQRRSRRVVLCAVTCSAVVWCGAESTEPDGTKLDRTHTSFLLPFPERSGRGRVGVAIALALEVKGHKSSVGLEFDRTGRARNPTPGRGFAPRGRDLLERCWCRAESEEPEAVQGQPGCRVSPSPTRGGRRPADGGLETKTISERTKLQPASNATNSLVARDYEDASVMYKARRRRRLRSSQSPGGRVWNAPPKTLRTSARYGDTVVKRPRQNALWRRQSRARQYERDSAFKTVLSRQYQPYSTSKNWSAGRFASSSSPGVGCLRGAAAGACRRLQESLGSTCNKQMPQSARGRTAAGVVVSELARGREISLQSSAPARLPTLHKQQEWEKRSTRHNRRQSQSTIGWLHDAELDQEGTQGPVRSVVVVQGTHLGELAMVMLAWPGWPLFRPRSLTECRLRCWTAGIYARPPFLRDRKMRRLDVMRRLGCDGRGWKRLLWLSFERTEEMTESLSLQRVYRVGKDGRIIAQSTGLSTSSCAARPQSIRGGEQEHLTSTTWKDENARTGIGRNRVRQGDKDDRKRNLPVSSADEARGKGSCPAPREICILRYRAPPCGAASDSSPVKATRSDGISTGQGHGKSSGRESPGQSRRVSYSAPPKSSKLGQSRFCSAMSEPPQPSQIFPLELPQGRGQVIRDPRERLCIVSIRNFDPIRIDGVKHASALLDSLQSSHQPRWGAPKIIEAHAAQISGPCREQSRAAVIGPRVSEVCDCEVTQHPQSPDQMLPRGRTFRHVQVAIGEGNLAPGQFAAPPTGPLAVPIEPIEPIGPTPEISRRGGSFLQLSSSRAACCEQDH